MKVKTISTYLAAASFFSGSGAFAQTTQLDSHVHGESSLNVVVTESEIVAEFESPAINIVGFEYKPTADKDKKALSDALAMLEKGELLFLFPDSQTCRLEHAHSRSTHEEHHDEHKHDEDHDKHHDEHKEGGTHSEIHAEYEFTCQPGNLPAFIDTGFISTFPGIESIHYQLIAPKGQSGGELDSNNIRITIQP